MANNLASNPLRFDAVSGGAVTGARSILAIVWTGIAATSDIAAADDFQLTSTDGTVIAEKRAVAAGDDYKIEFPKPFRCDGLILTALDGGVCYVYEE